MVELRKRKAPAEIVAPPAKKASSVKGAASKVKAAITGSKDETANANSSTKITVGDTINLDDFGGEVETNDGKKTSLKALVDESKGGVVLFTYPKASTPGCTTQVCLFRDSYTSLTSTGLSIYGLSRDSPKSNTTFKTKQSLPYDLLCDPSATLIAAIGLKKAAGTTRGVFVVDKAGKVLAAEAGGPAATVEVVRKLLGGEKVKDKENGNVEVTTSKHVGAAAAGSKANKEVDMEDAKPTEEVAKAPSGEVQDEGHAEVAADVANSAEKLDEPVAA